jgi:flagellar motility protein MotE (MotC chaperone)
VANLPRLNILDDVTAFYRLRINNSKSFIEILGQQIQNLNNFALVAKNDIQEKMRQVKRDQTSIVQYSSMVDRAKADYISVRRKQLDVEANEGLTETEKADYLKQLEGEKELQFETLEEEVKQFNQMLDDADNHFVRIYCLMCVDPCVGTLFDS